MKFDIYRAYGEATATRKAVKVDEETLKAHRVKVDYQVEDVVAEGKPDKQGNATFESDETITRVVFFTVGEDDDGEVIETVVGSVDVHADGDISVACPDPEPAPDPTEIV